MIGDEAMEEDKHKEQAGTGQGSQGELRDGAGAKASDPACEECEEAQQPLSLKAPYRPTAKEIADHGLTHCPPRAWCDHCVRGQYKDRAHVGVGGQFADSAITRVNMDYCYVKEDIVTKSSEHVESSTARSSMTVLVMQESMCASVWTYAVEVKGSGDEWLPEQLVEDFETIGLTQERLILKADQEPSITDMQRVVVKRRAGHGTALEQSHVGVSNSNGRVERAIQDYKGFQRTHRSALEENIGSNIYLDSPIMH